MSAVQYQKENGIAIIRLNRENVFNSFNKEQAFSLLDRLKEAEEDTSVRAILLTGNGKAFCAGQDLAEITVEGAPSIGWFINNYYNPLILLLRSIEKPIVCGVNGVAAGAGANIAFACDITIAKKSAKFIQAFSKIGLIPDSAGTFILPRMIGFQKASALMMLGDKLSADEAESMGMIYKAVEDEEYEEQLMKVVSKLAQMPTVGLGLTKKLLNLSFQNNLEQQLEAEGIHQELAAKSKDYQEGVNAFLEKRKPNFTGE